LTPDLEDPMNDPLVLDEFHLTLFVPADLDETQIRAARQILDHPAFRVRLARAVRRLLDRYEALRALSIEASR